MEYINKLNDEILFLFLNLDMVPRNSTSEGFAYIWQSKWVGMIATKTERVQIHFLSDFLVAVASLDLKVAIPETIVEHISTLVPFLFRKCRMFPWC